MSPQRDLRALAVNRKYDDCHGGPSPTPQELTRAGHRQVDGRGTGPLGDFRPTGGPGGVEKEIMRPVFQRNLARFARIPSGKRASWPLPVSPKLRAQPPVTRLPRSLPVRGKQRVRREDFWCNAPVNSRESIVQQLAVETAMPTTGLCDADYENATALHKSRNKQTSRSKNVPAKIFILARERENVAKIIRKLAHFALTPFIEKCYRNLKGLI
ncbi:hypothetical protein ALC56_12107 [Trachymyrmex septentrionalis]|uniref:Uncharacterized protein n=1 Tax=Trachymyrmex septentrionalis TaxID=34720 RepID=A0A195EYM5_9HYME|nr:hypothetical protein ALC56_12107 [Trachymyrmex septentrionalis]